MITYGPPLISASARPTCCLEYLDPTGNSRIEKICHRHFRLHWSKAAWNHGLRACGTFFLLTPCSTRNFVFLRVAQRILQGSERGDLNFHPILPRPSPNTGRKCRDMLALKWTLYRTVVAEQVYNPKCLKAQKAGRWPDSSRGPRATHQGLSGKAESLARRSGADEITRMVDQGREGVRASVGGSGPGGGSWASVGDQGPGGGIRALGGGGLVDQASEAVLGRYPPPVASHVRSVPPAADGRQRVPRRNPGFGAIPGWRSTTGRRIRSRRWNQLRVCRNLGGERRIRSWWWIQENRLRSVVRSTGVVFDACGGLKGKIDNGATFSSAQPSEREFCVGSVFLRTRRLRYSSPRSSPLYDKFSSAEKHSRKLFYVFVIRRRINMVLHKGVRNVWRFARWAAVTKGTNLDIFSV
jgi:hypothetical protein